MRLSPTHCAMGKKKSWELEGVFNKENQRGGERHILPHSSTQNSSSSPSVSPWPSLGVRSRNRNARNGKLLVFPSISGGGGTRTKRAEKGEWCPGGNEGSYTHQCGKASDGIHGWRSTLYRYNIWFNLTVLRPRMRKSILTPREHIHFPILPPKPLP